MYPVKRHPNDVMDATRRNQVLTFLRQITHECHVRIKINNFFAQFAVELTTIIIV